MEVMREHEHVLCEPRVLTDLRPVFGKNEEPAAGVIVHTMKIKYHEGAYGPLKEFFVALNSEDIEELRDILDRATRKEESLRRLATEAGLRCLDLESH